MNDVCRLCCTTHCVRNHIFDDTNALHVKMSLYMPIKVHKDDLLPQRICDKCSLKVNDLYQFCNEALEAQKKLHMQLVLKDDEVLEGNNVDLSRVKNCSSPLDFDAQTNYQSSQQPQSELLQEISNKITDFNDVEVKTEPKDPDQIKSENELDNHDYDHHSDGSDDVTLSILKKQKKPKKSRKRANGIVKSKGTGKRKKSSAWKGQEDDQDWRMLVEALPKGTTIGVVDDVETKEEDTDSLEDLFDKKVPDPEVFVCCICAKRCSKRGAMILHYKSHESDLAPAELPPTPPLPDTDPIKCTRCNKVLDRTEWAQHWYRHWTRDVDRPYRCARCERSFQTPQQILKHGLTHHRNEDHEINESKRFICDLCPEGFVFMRYLLAHRAQNHPEAASEPLALKCAECGKSFAHLNSLRRHIRGHTGERNHLCNVCGKTLTSREHLKFHLRIHTGYKPNICKTCGKGFVKKCNLTLHERTHSGEKPYVCSHCNKAFSQRSTLVIHERYHSGDRPYICGLCGRGFVAKGLLSMHVKTTCI